MNKYRELFDGFENLKRLADGYGEQIDIYYDLLEKITELGLTEVEEVRPQMNKLYDYVIGNIRQLSVLLAENLNYQDEYAGAIHDSLKNAAELSQA